MNVIVRLRISSVFKCDLKTNVINHRWLSSRRPTLYESLKVVKSSPDVFVQSPENIFVYSSFKRLYGGQLIGSAVYAAQKTLNGDFPLHSVHSYFLRPADNSAPILYKVSRLRDGKSFATRSITAQQNGHAVFECAMNFHQQEKGIIEHQISMSHQDVVPPEKLSSRHDLYQQLLHEKKLTPESRRMIAISVEMPVRMDVRYCHERNLFQSEPMWPAKEFVWIKSLDPLPDYADAHRAAIAYCSDRVLLLTALLPYDICIARPRIQMQASLDHSMWFHDDFIFNTNDEAETVLPNPIRCSADVPLTPPKMSIRADDWLLYELECPIYRNNRALTFGRIWTRNGRLIASCAQEGVIRCR